MTREERRAKAEEVSWYSSAVWQLRGGEGCGPELCAEEGGRQATEERLDIAAAGEHRPPAPRTRHCGTHPTVPTTHPSPTSTFPVCPFLPPTHSTATRTAPGHTTGAPESGGLLWTALRCGDYHLSPDSGCAKDARMTAGHRSIAQPPSPSTPCTALLHTVPPFTRNTAHSSHVAGQRRCCCRCCGCMIGYGHLRCLCIGGRMRAWALGESRSEQGLRGAGDAAAGQSPQLTTAGCV